MMLNDVLQTDRKLKVYIFDIIECVLGQGTGDQNSVSGCAVLLLAMKPQDKSFFLDHILLALHWAQTVDGVLVSCSGTKDAQYRLLAFIGGNRSEEFVASIMERPTVRDTGISKVQQRRGSKRRRFS